MNDNKKKCGWMAAARRAVRAEMVRLNAVPRGEPDSGRDPGDVLQEILDEAACAFAAATLGAVTRYAGEHPDDEDPELRSLKNEAEQVASMLPLGVQPMWQMHYIEGRSLADYAQAAGLDASGAQRDYLALLRELGRVMPRRGDVARPGVRRAVARAAGTEEVPCG